MILTSKSIRLAQRVRPSLARLPNARQFTFPAHHPVISSIKAATPDKVAIRHVPSGNSYTYAQMLYDIGFWREKLQELTAGKPGQRVAIMGENSYQFAVAFYASLSLPNTLAVPLCTNHTAAEIEYQLEDSKAALVITPERFLDKVEQFNRSDRPVFSFEVLQPDSQLSEKKALTEEHTFDDSSFENSGYMLYTSGTSGNPKGVVTPLETFMAQSAALTAAWNINESTNFLHTLPLHHVHGVLIALTLPIMAGARVEFQFPFTPRAVLGRLATSSKDLPRINTYTAVPTIYSKLIEYIDKEVLPKNKGELPAPLAQGFENLKLAMCGSASLPDPIRNGWDRVTGGVIPLLERYGMTETGIVLSQSLEPSKRAVGTVGQPVPSVVARIMDHDTKEILYDSSSSNAPADGVSGDLLLGGPTIFKEYWDKPEATKETFLNDSEGRWLITGDVASVDQEHNIKILGRASMDIIKSGGEKLSALEIEREILGIPHVVETAVVGLPSEQWGDQATAIIMLAKEAPADYKSKFDLAYLKAQLKEKLSGYKIPKEILLLETPIPRNQMGKVNKKSLVKTLFKDRL